MPPFRLEEVKAVAFRELVPGGAAREFILSLPDDVSQEQIDLLFPSIVKMLRAKGSG